MGSNATTLSIEERILASCEEGSLQAEYALFKPRDARAEIPAGEAAFVTSAGEARARLESAGVSLALAEEASAAMKADVLDAYAMADVVRTVGPRLGAYEFFEGQYFDPSSQLYEGAWLDLRALATDLNVPGAGLALQALHLVAAIAECEPEARVVLTIGEDASPRRADKAFHRVPHDYVRRLLTALRALRPSGRRARVKDREEVRRALARLVRERALGKPTEPARKRLELLEQAIAGIDVPSRGPLASVELWAIERQLADNDPRGVEQKLDVIERARGKTPATRYLREHAAFVRGTDPPRRIAERLSHWMRPGTPFYELDLLKARAWLAAAMPGYARHYARGLVEDRGAPDSVCLVALEILDVTSARSRTMPPPPVAAPGGAPTSVRSAPIVVLGPRGSLTREEQDEVADRASSPRDDDADSEPSTTREEREEWVHPSWLEGRPPSAPLDDLLRSPTPSDAPRSTRASVPPPLPATAAAPEGSRSRASSPARDEVLPRRPSAPPRDEIVARRPSSPPRDEVRPPRASNVSREELLARTVPAGRAIPQLPKVTAALLPTAGARPPSANEPGPETERMAELVTTTALARVGDRQPRDDQSYVTDIPPPSSAVPNVALTAMPAPPRVYRYLPEDAETLALPPGLSEGMLPAGHVPRTPDEVRIACTRMSRELARDYRIWYGSRLQTSAIAVEAMQRHLLARWPDGKVEGEDAVWEMRRHGALLSEILARALGGYWVDVKPTEVGYWAMFIPPATRTWPFGRIVRFVSMGYREKDLVSYYLALVTRVRKLK
jgi:hypothetical protein